MASARRKKANRTTKTIRAKEKPARKAGVKQISAPAPRPFFLKPAFVFAVAVLAVMALLFFGYLARPPAAVQHDFEQMAVRGLTDLPADYNADEYYTYTVMGQSARVQGTVFKPTPCDSVKASAVRDLSNSAIVVRLEFSSRGTACEEVITPSEFNLFVDNVSPNDFLSVVADTRPLELNATTQFCGGIAAFGCPSGWECALDGDYPDAGGKCVRATN
jgi:hypothetical protein